MPKTRTSQLLRARAYACINCPRATAFWSVSWTSRRLRRHPLDFSTPGAGSPTQLVAGGGFRTAASARATASRATALAFPTRDARATRIRDAPAIPRPAVPASRTPAAPASAISGAPATPTMAAGAWTTPAVPAIRIPAAGATAMPAAAATAMPAVPATPSKTAGAASWPVSIIIQARLLGLLSLFSHAERLQALWAKRRLGKMSLADSPRPFPGSAAASGLRGGARPRHRSAGQRKGAKGRLRAGVISCYR
jgi:hypothetical protein